jgi:hypothetical protein
VTEYWTLVKRDHAEIREALRALEDATAPEVVRHRALTTLRLGFAAHAVAEAQLLASVLDVLADPPPVLGFVATQIVAAHDAQEAAVAELAALPIDSLEARARREALVTLLREHEAHEEAIALPALRDYLPPRVYDLLADAYATWRVRALAA